MEQATLLPDIFDESYTTDSLWEEQYNATLAEINKKSPARKPYEQAPITPRNLQTAMMYYYPELTPAFRNRNIFNEVDERHQENRAPDTQNAEHRFGVISSRLNEVYPQLHMDHIESYIRKAMLLMPFAISEYKAAILFNGSRHETDDLNKLSSATILNLILTASIDDWADVNAPNYTMNLEMINWLQDKLRKQEARLQKEWEDNNK